jgi:hypothetical protein
MKAFDFIVNLQQERPTAMSSCEAHFEVDPFPSRRFWPVEREIDAFALAQLYPISQGCRPADRVWLRSSVT